MFKKKTLKFTYEKVSRDIRHAQTLGARESSRFERLSMIRSINDSDLLNETSMEISKEKEFKAPPAPEIKPSRLEMLFKWKKEKEIKKEMERAAKKKPFYNGGMKNVTENKNFKSSFTAQSDASFNSSKFIRSKLGAPPATLASSKIPNSKQTIPKYGNSLSRSNSSASVSRKLPNSTADKILPKPASSLTRSNSSVPAPRKFQPQPSAIDKVTSSKVANITQRAPIVNKTPQSVPYAAKDLSKSNSKTFGSTLGRTNNTIAASRKPPTPSSTINKILPKPASSLTRSNSSVPAPRKFQPHPSVTDKVSSSKVANITLRAPIVNKTPQSVPYAAKDLSKPNSKTFGSTLGRTNNTIAASRKPPTPSSTINKLPVSSLNKKFGSNSKLNLKDNSQPKQNVPSSRKGFCFKTAAAKSTRQQDSLLKTPIQGTSKKLQSNSLKVKEKESVKEVCEQSLDCLPDVTFNSDISIIKPTRSSFAPGNFEFKPPEGLNSFIFDDEDDGDVYQTLEDIKIKFMSRTSTPSKDSDRRSSGVKSSKECSESYNLMLEEDKLLEKSNSNDISMSDLMTPKSKSKIENEEAGEASRIRKFNEVICELNTNIENKNAAVGTNQYTCEEDSINTNQEKELHYVSPIKNIAEGDIIPKQDNKLISVSPIKMIIKETDVVIDPEELTFVPPAQTDFNAGEAIGQETSEEINLDIKNKKETVEKITDDLSKKLFIETLPDASHIDENSNENAVEIISNKVQANQSLKNEVSESTAKRSLFPDYDGDDSLLDSIDLNEINLMKSDEDSEGEECFLSPQVPKNNKNSRKSNGAIPKRVSMLKKLSVMNSIVETVETDECAPLDSSKSIKKNQTAKKNTTQHSKNVPIIAYTGVVNDSPIRNSLNSPRRSLRLMKIPAASGANFSGLSPFQEKASSKNNLRRSMRLIDLSTPEKAACEKVLGENFENLDPNTFLIDFESPTVPAISKSKKVSLLYSPEKRKSIRKSIRGDLISFSPS